MRRNDAAFVWILAAAWALGCGPATAVRHDAPSSGALTANEALANVLATYATAATYVDDGDMVEVYATEGRESHTTVTTFTNAFVRPNRFRFALGPDTDPADPGASDDTGPRYQILRDGSFVASDFYLGEGPEQVATLDEAVGAAAGVSHGLSSLIEPLLFGNGTDHAGPFSRFVVVGLGEDAPVEGVECFALEADVAGGDHFRVLVGKDDYLIRQVSAHRSFSGAPSGALARLNPPSDESLMAALLLEMEYGALRPSTVDETITLRPRLNVDVPSIAFALEVRKEARARYRVAPYGGIGMRLNGSAREGWSIAGVFSGSPAERAALRPGDRIGKVDGVDATHETDDAILRRIKGAAGTEVRLTIERDHRLSDTTVRREIIDHFE